MQRFSRLIAAWGVTMAMAVIVGTIGTAEATAQRVDTIRANPDAVRLRQIWRKNGLTPMSGLTAVVSLPDVSGDSIGDFLATTTDPVATELYLGGSGGPVWEPVRKLDSAVAYIAGNFHGPERPVVIAYGLVVDTLGRRLIRLGAYRTDSLLNSVPSTEWWSGIPGDTTEFFDFLSDDRIMVAADLDHDGDDELMVITAGRRRLRDNNRFPDLLIFEGGPDFRMDTPTVIVRDPNYRDNWGVPKLYVGDLDGDTHPDIFTNYICADTGDGAWYMNHIYFGTGRLPTAETLPDRSFVNRSTTYRFADVDGDGVIDVVDHPGVEPMYLYLARSRSARTRSYAPEDADLILRKGVGWTIHAGNFPRVNGSPGGCMTAMSSGVDGVYEWVKLLFTKVDGIDVTYEAFASGAGDYSGPFHWLHDVDGDGWNDMYTSHGLGAGVIVIFAGGPYIPYDSLPSSAIREISLENRSSAVHLWPVPASDRVHIAWRGDLVNPPARFVVTDVLGRTVATGTVAPGDGEVLWDCGERPVGMYVVAFLDQHSSVLRSERIAVAR